MTDSKPPPSLPSKTISLYDVLIEAESYFRQQLKVFAGYEDESWWAALATAAAREAAKTLTDNSPCAHETTVHLDGISGVRCWHCRNIIMVAPELGCPTCGRPQDLTRLYFGEPSAVKAFRAPLSARRQSKHPSGGSCGIKGEEVG